MSATIETKQLDKIGDRFIKAGLLSEQQVNAIIDRQNEYNIRFGEAAIQLGFLTDQQVKVILSQQFNYATALVKNNNLSEKLVVAHDPFGMEAENIRHIRAEISVRLRNNYPIAFVLASSNKNEGKSYLASNLALAFSQMGKSTLLIDANMRDPSIHKLFSLNNKVGLSTILSERADYECIQSVTGFPDLSILTSGAVPPNPQEMMMNNGIKKIIDHFSDKFQVFIIDSPSVSKYADTQTIAEQIGMCLLIGKKDYTTYEDMTTLHQEITTSGATVIGSVFNAFSDEKSKPSVYKQQWNRISQWFQKRK